MVKIFFMSTRILLLFSFIVLSSSFAVASDRDKEIAQALTKVQEQKAQVQTWEGRNTDQPYVTLLNEYETKLNPDWTYEETYHTRVRVQKEEAKDLGQWPIYYNKSREEVKDIKAFIETPDGKKVQATNIQDIEVYDGSPMYGDMKVKVVALPQKVKKR